MDDSCRLTTMQAVEMTRCALGIGKFPSEILLGHFDAAFDIAVWHLVRDLLDEVGS